MNRETRAAINARCLQTDHLEGGMARRTAKGGVMAISTQLIRLVIQVAGSAVLARLLAPGDFGLIAMAATVTGFVALFSDLGLSSATIQRKAITQNVVSTLFYLGIAVGLVVTLITVAIAFAAAGFYGDERVKLLAISMSLAIPLGAAGSQHGALLARGMFWVRINAITIISQTVGMTAAVLLAWLTPISYWALVAQTLLTALVSVVLLWIACPWRPSLVLKFRDAREEIGFGLNLTGFSIANYFHRQADNVLIGRRWGETELGYYNRAYSLLLIPISLVNGAVGSVVMPLLSRHQDRPDQWRDYLLRALAFTCFACHAMACLLVVNSKEIIDVMLGPGWANSVPIFTWLGLSLFGMAPMNAMGWVFMSLGQTGRWFRWGIFTAIYFPAIFLVALPYGATGVAMAYAIAVSLVMIPCIAYAIRNAPVTLLQILRILRAPFVASAVTLALIMMVRPDFSPLHPFVGLAAGTALTGLVYAVAALAALLLDPAQKRQQETLLMLVRAGRSRFAG
jgi:PST family polysaccharide transporter